MTKELLSKWILGAVITGGIGYAFWDHQRVVETVTKNTTQISAQQAIQQLMLEELKSINDKIERIIERELERGRED